MEIYLVRGEVARLEHSYADARFSDLVVEAGGSGTSIRVTRKQEGHFDLESDRFLVQGNWESLRLRPRDAETWAFDEVIASPGGRLLFDDSLPARSVSDPLRSGVASVDSEARLFDFVRRRSLSTPGTTLFSHEGKLTDLGGRVIPQTEQRSAQAESPDALVWWLKNAAGSKQQVWVHLFATAE